MNKRSGHKRSMPKRTAKKERKGKKVYRKGSKSKTMKGKKDFTTKKTSKVFNRRKHYQKHAKGSRVIRRPYAKKGGMPQELPTGTSRPSLTGSGWVSLDGDGVSLKGNYYTEPAYTGPPPRQASDSTSAQRAHTGSPDVIVKTKRGDYVVGGPHATDSPHA